MKIDKMKRSIREEVARRKAEVLRDSVSRAEPSGQSLAPVDGLPQAQLEPQSPPDIDAMMRQVRESIGRRKGIDPPSDAGAVNGPEKSSAEMADRPAALFEPISLPRLSGPGGSLALKDVYTLADFLQFHDDEFVRNAYRTLLRREPDARGHAGYLAGLRSGRLAKADILGRIRFSAEGRSAGVRVRGLALPFALSTLRRVPLVGRIVGVVQYVVRLPEVVRNQERLEATFFHHESELKRQIDLAEAEIERLLTQSQQRASDADRESNARLDKALAAQLTFTTETSRLLTRVDGLDSSKLEAEKRFFAVERALERKAEDERITALNNHLASLIRSRPEQKSLDALASRTDNELRDIRAMLDLLTAGKADRPQIEAFGRQLEGTFARIQQVAVEIARHGAELTRLEAMVGDAREPFRESRLPPDSLSVAKADRAQIDLIVSDLRDIRMAKADIADVESSFESVRSDLMEQRRILLDQHRRVGALLDEWRKRAPKRAGADKAPDWREEEDHVLDAVYASFENRFRGEPQEIKKRLEVYLPMIREASAGTPSAPVLDLGCGRGDWLALLQEVGLTGTGVDLNRVNVGDCRDRGLDVIESDAVDYLRSLADGSIGAITGMHIIEHLPFGRLVMLIDESYRVLRTGGVLIFETPNPENMLVGSCNFWFDPTHQHPLPPATMNYFIEARGFSPVEIVRMHPYPENELLTEGAPGVIDRINQAFYSAQDYAVIATKAGT